MATPPSTAAAETAAAESTAELAALRAELAALRDENDQLLLQLHEVQEELEDEHRRLGPRPAAGSSHQGLSGSAHLLDMHEHGVHRHLQYLIKLPCAADDGVAKLHVRLLDHVGRPGLGLLAKRSGELPLSAWQATGQEEGREFMLLVPTDEQGQALLRSLGRSDWQRVNDVARLILDQVCKDGWAFGSHWQATAARLCRQLADLPPRWRCDELVVSRPEGGAAAELDVVFGGVSYANRGFDAVRLRWRLAEGAADGPSLRWLRPDIAGDLPLGGWPTDERGDLAPAMALPVGSDGSVRVKRQRWAAMTAADRDLVLALLEALPAAADRAPAEALPPGITPASLRREASSLQEESRRLVTALKLRGVARRLLRRDSPVAGGVGR